jgi:hypothetical protein
MQRGSVLPLLLVIVLVAAVGVGAFFIKYSRTDTTSDASFVPPIVKKALPSPSPKPQIIKDEISGLSFELPLGFSFKEETEEEYFKRANGQIRKNFASYIAYPPAEFVKAFYILPEAETNLDNSVLAVWVFQNPEDLNPQDFYKKYWYYPFIWGDFTSRKEGVAPNNQETIAEKEAMSGTVDHRPGKPKFIYLPLKDKNLMLQIQYPTEASSPVAEILDSFKFE